MAKPPPGAGYSGTPLVRKLGIKPGHRIVLIDAPPNYLDLLGSLPDDVMILEGRSRARPDFVHIFARTRKDLRRDLDRFRRRIVADGMIWVSWPKKASAVPTELTREDVRELGLTAGLVDVKVCAVDATWSGLKFVIRVRDRR